MYALSHNADRLKSPLSALKTSPGFWFLVAAAGDYLIVDGGFAGFAVLVALAAAGATCWPPLQKTLQSW